jgi:hypothetical protein
MSKRRIVIGLVVLALAACKGEPGSTTDQNSTAPSAANNDTAARVTHVGNAATHGPDACTLLSADDLKRITGLDYAAGVAATGNTGKQCRFDSANGQGPSIDLAIRDSADFKPPTGAEAVSGAGEAAWWNGGAKQFIVKKGDRILIIAFSGASTDPKPWGQAIASAAANKL